MKKSLSILFFILSVVLSRLVHAQSPGTGLNGDSLYALVMGNFTDDYNIRYTISDTVWIQHPNVKFHILKWNKAANYVIARNDEGNPGEADLYTRIDYMSFNNMAPYLWGFCLTAYNASSPAAAESSAPADRKSPKKGCNGFPFSRMKRAY